MKKSLTYFLLAMALLLPIAHSVADAQEKAQEKVTANLVDLNKASVEELMSLPGIGKTKAEAIIAYRQAHPFRAVSELVEVKGIGPKMLEKIQAKVTVSSTAAAAPIR